MAMSVPDDAVGRSPNSAFVNAHTLQNGTLPKSSTGLVESPATTSSGSAFVTAHTLQNGTLPKSSTGLDEGQVGSPAIDGYYSLFGDDLDANRPSHACYFPANFIYGFAYWYSTKMDECPVLTKSLTGGCSSIVGDIVAQCIENGTPLRLDSTEGLHWRRIFAMFCTGLSYGPMLHYIYEFYEHVLPINIDEQINQCIDTDDAQKVEDPTFIDNIVDDIQTTYFCHSTMFHSYYTISHRKCVNAFLHVLIDQGLMAFAFVAIMMFVTGVVEGHWHNLAEEFERDYIDNIHRLWIAALVAIGPIQMMAFRFLSLKWRALVVSFLDVFEVSMMSYINHRNREEL